MKKIILLSLLIFTSCSKKEDLELEIITKHIKCLNIKSGNNGSFLNNDEKHGINKNAKTIVTYKLTNNSNKIYYFNLNKVNNQLEKSSFKLNNAYVNFLDEQNEYLKVKTSYYSIDSANKTITKENYDYRLSVELNNNFTQRKTNFLIHPKESVFFEYFIVLPYGNYLEGNANWVELDSQKKYFAEILLSSDSTNYKKFISRTDLQTIKQNGYEVYHGIIKSKNKIPIKFVDLPKK